jgi:hypothetical protein
MSEPWSINRWIAIGVVLVLAIIFGSFAANSDYESLLIVAVWLAASAVIVFVQDYWWAPVLIITAFGFSTNLGGIPLSGMEVGLAILCLALPTKMAMKTLRKAEPPMTPSVFYWLLLGYVTVHAVSIIAYNHTMGVQLKNIVKAYYTAITPLIFYGLVIRYCHVRTVRPTMIALFCTIFFTVFAALFVTLTGVTLDFSELHFSLTWLTEMGSNFVLRYAAVYLFIFCLAYWPAARNNFGKVALAIGTVVSALGVLLSGGRLSLATALLAGVFFAIVRGKLWLALPFIVFGLGAATIISIHPDVMNGLPDGAQRALAPLNFSDQQTQVEETLQGSNEWHEGLRQRSYDYWLADLNSFYFGHGYKSWDPALDQVDQMTEEDANRMAELAIEMGLTENMFSSITNIFGIAGLLLYFGFLGHLAWMLLKAHRMAPAGSVSRALCEFSLVNLVAALLFMFVMGSVPGLTLFYWTLGVLGARPYLSKQKAPVPAAAERERPAFARPAYATQPAQATRAALPQQPRLRPRRA